MSANESDGSAEKLTTQEKTGVDGTTGLTLDSTKASGSTNDGVEIKTSQVENNSISKGGTDPIEPSPDSKPVDTNDKDAGLANVPAIDSEPTPHEKHSKAKTKHAKGTKVSADTAVIGFIGAGKMTEMIIRGLKEKKAENAFFVASKSAKTHDMFKQMGVTCTKRLYDIFAKHEADIIFMSVHGSVIQECFKMGGSRPLALTVNFIPIRSAKFHILSLIGGVPISDIKSVLLNPDMPEKYKLDIHRIMLNCSVAYGIGLGVIDAEPDSKKVQPIVRDLLVKFAKIEYHPESQIDILCCVGGAGMAFIYYYLAALADGGFKMGLPKNTAVKLAAKTMLSSALCMLESGKHASELRDSCTGPSGAAIYGIANLEKHDCASGVTQAVEAAFKRLKELVNIPCV